MCPEALIKRAQDYANLLEQGKLSPAAAPAQATHCRAGQTADPAMSSFHIRSRAHAGSLQAAASLCQLGSGILLPKVMNINSKPRCIGSGSAGSDAFDPSFQDGSPLPIGALNGI